MKHRIYPVFIIIGIFISINSYSQITFNKTYHFGVDLLLSVVPIDSGYAGCISAGYPISPRSTNFSKFDTIGNLVYFNPLGQSSDYYMDRSILINYAGDFVSGGIYSNNLTQHSSLSVKKWNITGDTIWTRNYIPDSSKDYDGLYMCTTSDSGYCIAGYSTDTITDDTNICCLKIDDNGNMVWYYELPTINNDFGVSVVAHSNGNYYITGTTRNFGNGNINERDAFLLKLNSNGQFQWIKAFGSRGPNEMFWGIEETHDHQLLIAGLKYYVGFDSHAGIWKVDTAGNTHWQNYYSYPSNITEIYWAHETSNGEIIAIGTARNPIILKDDGWVLKVDSLGNKLWDRAFRAGNNHCYMNDSKQTKDKGFIIAGYAFEGASGNQDAWLVKLDSLGCDSAGCPTLATGLFENSTTSGIGPVLFPNPCKEMIRVKTHSPDEFDTAEVYSISGQWQNMEMFQQRDFLEINTSSLQPGLYVMRLKSGNQFVNVRFIKE